MYQRENEFRSKHYNFGIHTFIGVTLYVETPVMGVELRFSAVKNARALSPGLTLT